MDQGNQGANGLPTAAYLCRGCSYDLRGAGEKTGNCPECGASYEIVVPGERVTIELNCVGCEKNVKGLEIASACPHCQKPVRDSVLAIKKGVPVDRESLWGVTWGWGLLIVWLPAALVKFQMLPYYLKYPKAEVFADVVIVAITVLDFRAIKSQGKTVVPGARVHEWLGPVMMAGALAVWHFDSYWGWVALGVYSVYRHLFLAMTMNALRVYPKLDRMGFAIASTPLWAVLAAMMIQIPVWGMAGVLVFMVWFLALLFFAFGWAWTVDRVSRTGWTKLRGDEAVADWEAMMAATRE